MSGPFPAPAGGGGSPAVAGAPLAPPLDRFAIGFDPRDRARLHALWDEVIDRQRWSEGPMAEAFEAAWSSWNGLGAVAFGGWAGAALAALDFAGVAGQTVGSNSRWQVRDRIAAAEQKEAMASVGVSPKRRDSTE